MLSDLISVISLGHTIDSKNQKKLTKSHLSSPPLLPSLQGSKCSAVFAAHNLSSEHQSPRSVQFQLLSAEEQRRLGRVVGTWTSPHSFSLVSSGDADFTNSAKSAPAVSEWFIVRHHIALHSVLKRTEGNHVSVLSKILCNFYHRYADVTG